jgi:phosphoribosylanthranilate isomerase
MARSYGGAANMLPLDSHRPGDVQIGALGVTRSWDSDRRMVEGVAHFGHHCWRTRAQ